jgi:hypothetical protein
VKVLQAITFWSEDPRNTLTLLRQAIADALEAQRLESMPSEFVKAEYIRLVQALADPDQRYHQIPKSPEGGEWQYSPAIQIPRLFVENEPELTLRLARQVYSRWLAQCDRPPVKRTPIHQVTHSASFYTTPANTDFGMTDADLAAWIDRSTLFSSYSTSLFLSLSLLDTDRDTPRRAALHLAQNLYVRESGKPPPSLGDLVGAWYPVGEPLPGEYRPSDPPLP